MTSVVLPSMLTRVLSEVADELPHFIVVVSVALPPAEFDG